jgi:hypothetical protein
MPEISLGELGVQWFEDGVELVTGWFHDGLAEGYQVISSVLFGTPTPVTRGALVFGPPTNSPWPMLYDALVGGEVTVLALLTLVVAVQGRHVIRIFNIGSAYEERRTKRTAWTGAFLIVSWYWIATVTLLLVEGFTLAVLPDVDLLIDAMQQFLAVSLLNPALALLMAVVGGVAMWILQALFFVRRLLIFIYLYGMPFGIALAFANIPVVSRVARSLCLRFIPLVILPLPVAILFAGYGFLFASTELAFTVLPIAFLKLLIATSLPVLAVWVSWKTFGDAAPAITRVTGAIGRTAVTVGAIAGVSAVGGPTIARTAGVWGPRRALQTAAANKIARRNRPESNENDVRDANGDTGVPAYRRTENDPGYY